MPSGWEAATSLSSHFYQKNSTLLVSDFEKISRFENMYRGIDVYNGKYTLSDSTVISAVL